MQTQKWLVIIVFVASFMALDFTARSTLHVAIIMDGNGRWATCRGLPRIAGHRAGADAVRRVVEAALDLGIGTLTLYAFSSDNWRRPAPEVSALMGLLQRYMTREAKRCLSQGVRISVVGRRDRLSGPVLAAIEKAEDLTQGGCTLHLRLAIDYSARDAIVSAVRRLAGTSITRELLARELHSPDVDLLIRTGGEKRLSDFLLWESAYAELVFAERMWPEFDAGDLRAAVECFKKRERRFGQVPQFPAIGRAVFENGDASSLHHLRGDRWLR